MRTTFSHDMLCGHLSHWMAYPLAQDSVERLLWGSPEWAVPVLIVGLALIVLTLWNYSKSGRVGWSGAAAAMLKITAVLLMAICLLQPMRSGTRPRPQANIVPILIDNSQSMQVKTEGAKTTRGEQALQQLDRNSRWRARLSQDFDVRDYSFDARLDRLSSEASDLGMDGTISSLRTSLQSLAQQYASRPIGGVVLFTDGNLTDTPEADFDWSSLGFAVYPVVSAKQDRVRDLRIGDFSIRQTDFESAPVTLRLRIDSTAMQSQAAFVQLRDLSDMSLVQEQRIELDSDNESKEVTFRFRPTQPGSRFYRAVVFTESDREALEQVATEQQTLARSSEATLVNNERIIAIDRRSGPYRILYVSGRPNWEYKFLRRALSTDAEIQLVGLLRIANKEPKFSFRDQAVSGANPLFQGLGADAEEVAEQYDEPVIIRLGVKESEELSDGFPDSPEELFAYQAVILDDIEPEFFSQDQLLLLRRFVALRGGGLLMLGGQESFGSKRFAESPLGELSAVYAPRSGEQASSDAYQMQLTREGLLQPWVRLRDNEAAETDRLMTMPWFNTLNMVGDAKPGAQVLAVVTNRDGQNFPAIVSQRFGKGRSAAIPIGDLWRWSMRQETVVPQSQGNRKVNAEDPPQFWRQIAHWLVAEVPRRVEATAESSSDPSQPVQIVVTARDEAYLPLDNCTVELTVKPITGESFSLKATPDATRAGVYQASYWSRDRGAYRVQASVSAADGSPVGTAETLWTAEPNAAEFQNLATNQQLLQTIADQTGGRLVSIDSLDTFAKELPNQKMPETEVWVYPLWHQTWVMLLAIGCLCCEWGLRRWKGLA